MKPFDSIINITIERIYQLFEISSGQQSELANVGGGQVADVKKMIIYMINDPENEKEIRKIERGKDHIRFRLTNQSRYSCPITRPYPKFNQSERWGANNVHLQFLRESLARRE